jgi:plastocyanin
MVRSAVTLAITFAMAGGCSGGCSNKGEPSPEPAAAPAPVPAAAAAPGSAPAAPAGTGTIRGTVKLLGPAPERAVINMKSEPACAKQGTKDEDVVVGAAGGLKNVVVHVVSGPAAKAATPAEEVVMDQQGCMYRPHVLVAQAGQPVVVKSSDQVLHNIHTYRGTATLFNQALVFGMPPIRKKFPGAGDVVKFKCDVHPWMTGYLLVTDNPFHAVSGEDGSFAIRDVPAGSYTVEVWHERLGTQKKQVTVAPDKTAELSLEYSAK